MALKDSIKHEARIEREKLSNMSLKDKIWYIWEYYKVPIIAVIIIVSVAISVGTTIYNNRFDTALYCVVVNNRTSQEVDETKVLEEIKEYLGLSDIREIVYDSSMYVSYGNSVSELSYATMAKISALVASRDLDIMIADTENIDHYAELGGMSNLEEVLPQDLYETVKDRLYYAKDENGVKIPCAVSLEDTKFAEDLNLSMDPPLISLFSNSEHTDHCISLLHYIFG